jgi:hypothetical protein
MPRAMTLEEKKERAEAIMQERQESKTTSSGRTRRSAFNGTEGKLKINVPEIEGYHLHIFNDTAGRIDAALSTGYEFVTPEEVGGVGQNVVSRNTDIGDKVRFLVGKSEDGGPMYAYLMKIRQDWYNEDQAAMQQRNNLVDEAIRKGRTPGVDNQGFYVPKGGISLK